jgi:hypothetical protein
MLGTANVRREQAPDDLAAAVRHLTVDVRPAKIRHGAGSHLQSLSAHDKWHAALMSGTTG